MKIKKYKLSTFAFVLFQICIIKVFSQPAIEWQKAIGGTGSDLFYIIHQTMDGGYIMGGYSDSDSSGNKSASSFGGNDYWVVKTDSAGIVEWEKTVGGSANEILTGIAETSTGDFIIGGSSESDSSGNKESHSFGFFDFWVIKLDSSGQFIWQKDFGGSGEDQLRGLTILSDGGILLSGFSNSDSSGTKSGHRQGGMDYWLLKIDSAGDYRWDKTLGGINDDLLFTSQETSDGGLILCGYSNSGISGNKTDSTRGLNDYWIIKLDSVNEIRWQRTIGGSGDDGCSSMIPTSDGGYLIGGTSESGIASDKTDSCRGLSDFWVVKLDNLGVPQWQKTYGGTTTDNLNWAQQTIDDGYIFGGYSDSGINGEKSDSSRGGVDYWIIKTDSVGIIEWQKTLGGTGNDFLLYIEAASDGSIIAGGRSRSPISGDKTEDTVGVVDYWIVKLVPSIFTGINQNNIISNELSIYPNPGNGIINVNLGNACQNEKMEMRVFNIHSQEILRKNIQSTSSQVTLGDINEGIYLVMISDPSGDIVYSKKYIYLKNY